MCLVVYLASADPLPTTKWMGGMGVALTDLAPEADPVRAQFTLPNVYGVASSEGCGCGFLTHYKSGTELEESLAERRALSALLSSFPGGSKQFQLLIAYDGYETKPIDTCYKMEIEKLETCDFNKGWDYHVILVELEGGGQ